MRKIFTIILFAIALVSCNDDLIRSTYEGESDFAFAGSVLNVEVDDTYANVIKVPVYRGTLSNNMADVSLEDTTGLFTLVTSRVVFADNQNTAFAEIRYSDIDRLGLTTKYHLTLSISGMLSPSNRGKLNITVNRKLTFEYLGKADFFDACIFENHYQVDAYKAKEAEIYRLIQPYYQGLVAEEYADNGWMGKTLEYLQFSCNSNGYVTYEPFNTGMLVNGKYAAYAYYPGEYIWGKDFSDYNLQNKKVSDKIIQLYPVYCLPDYQYGFLNDGVYPLTIVLP